MTLPKDSAFNEIVDRLTFTKDDLRKAYEAGYEEGIVPAFELWFAEYIKGQ